MSAASTEELKMANPRFAGIDDEGKPFEITADCRQAGFPEGENMVDSPGFAAEPCKATAMRQTVVTAEKAASIESEERICWSLNRDGVTL